MLLSNVTSGYAVDMLVLTGLVKYFTSNSEVNFVICKFIYLGDLLRTQLQEYEI